MVSKKRYQLPRTILLSGVAIAVVVIASFMFLFLGGSHQSLAANKLGHTALNTMFLNAPISTQATPASRSLALSPTRVPKVIGPYIDVNPAKGVKGTLVRIRGFKFGPGETVDITFGTQTATVQADQFGRFFVTIRAGGGPGIVNITCQGRTTKLVATFAFNVLPVLAPNVRPLNGRPGTRVFVSGGLFPPGDTVTANLVCQQTSCVGAFLGTFKVFSNGTIRGSFTIPNTNPPLAPGQYNIVFSDTSGDTVSVPFTINP
jgi:hypothetical protein